MYHFMIKPSNSKLPKFIDHVFHQFLMVTFYLSNFFFVKMEVEVKFLVKVIYANHANLGENVFQV